MKTIPLHLATNADKPDTGIEIDGGLVARKLGLEAEAFRKLLHNRKVAILCERGTGEDEGLYRATFYFEKRRFRAVLDRSGCIIQTEP